MYSVHGSLGEDIYSGNNPNVWASMGLAVWSSNEPQSSCIQWYSVMWEIARVKQGSALLLSGWVTACVVPSRHLSGLGAVASNHM